VAVWLVAAGAVVLTAGVPSGRDLFHKVWTAEEGLGPRFNAASCASCHSDEASRDAAPADPVLVWVASSAHDPTGGHLFQRFRIRADGAVSAFPPPERASRRRAPALFGVGLLDQAELPVRTPGGRVTAPGRFGWKARYSTLEAMIAGALAAEMGLTSEAQDPAGAATAGSHPEVSADQLHALVAYVRDLPPPAPLPFDAEARKGEGVFARIGCASCHRQRLHLRAAAHSPSAVSAYTDLALHDLGAALADGLVEGAASPRQFRTAPLWGLHRLRGGYLHDARAGAKTFPLCFQMSLGSERVNIEPLCIGRSS
jgi:CxxC motif-containing protein (DUF1111 family)